MNKIVIKNGVFASLILLGATIGSYLLGFDSDYDLGEIIGYSAMFLSMIFVFLGIREYRNKELNGAISFGNALKVGLLIVLIPSLLFGIYNVIYVEVLEPDFTEKYFTHSLEKMKNTMSASEYEKAALDMEEQKVFFSSTPLSFAVMFLTVFLMGLVTSIISSFILKRQS